MCSGDSFDCILLSDIDAEAKQYPGGMRDTFEIPNAEGNIRGYKGEKSYRLLEDDGIVSESTVIGGDILIGKTPRFMEEYRDMDSSGPYRRDTSIGVRPSEKATDTVVMTQSNLVVKCTLCTSQRC